MSTTGILNRLKAKLSSQQFSAKEIASLAERENEIKQKAINQAICDTVSAAINSDEFTKAVAEKLAVELNPSLKNLDPSTYYTKLQLSIDKISQQFEAQDTKLTHLSTILESNNTSTAEKITNIEAIISNILKAQEKFEVYLKSVEERQKTYVDHVATEVVTTNISNQIESAKNHLVDTVKTSSPNLTTSFDDLKKVLDINSSKLDELKSKELSSEVLASIENFKKLQNTHSTDLGKLKLSSETYLNNTVKLRADSDKISSELTTVRDHIDSLNILLSEIKNSSITGDILAETKASNISHTQCLSILEEIKSRQLEILPIISDSNSSHESHAKALTDLKQIELEILDGLNSVNTILSDQSKIITDTRKSLTNEVASAAGLVTTSDSIAKLKGDINTLNISLNDIKSTIVDTPPVTPKVDISDIESSIQAIFTSIGELKSINESLSEKVELKPVISSLETQSNQLSDIKSNLVEYSTTKVDLSSINSSIKDISSKLETQISNLNELKAAIKSREETETSGS